MSDEELELKAENKTQRSALKKVLAINPALFGISLKGGIDILKEAKNET